ncbi:YgjP-like metallopeptidase domain-containing protein [Sphingobacterium bovisgrunnientis]|uniref:YgjP-like metallopeptidase domain-containing protein n=1 Tax=Sphingobacterium bovisgrunnientis TaxID=1874697 RepID=UPI00135B57EA|nr:YgjP-like metallopeptidase domain-containing protein [Sphingobacterium bovisgrunnientis]
MYLEIGEKTYFIHIKTDIDSIILKKIEHEIVHLDVPARIPQENLIVYIKQELPKLISAHKKSLNTSLTQISLFDKIYPIKIEPILSAHIKNEILYGNKKHFSTATNLEKLKFTLLLNFINSKLSYLEEDLNLILPETNLKKLKTKYYSICHTNGYITYSKTLIDKSKDFITYVVIRAVGIFLRCSEEQIDDLINKYVSNPKHFERVFKYEQ